MKYRMTLIKGFDMSDSPKNSRFNKESALFEMLGNGQCKKRETSSQRLKKRQDAKTMAYDVCIILAGFFRPLSSPGKFWLSKLTWR